MDHDVLVELLLERCKGFIEGILQAPDLHSVASASLAIFAQMRQVAHDILQAKITLEAQQLKRADVTLCCQEAGVTYVHTRTVSPETLFGEITIPVRTFQCRGCGALLRPDDGPLGVPEAGEFTDDVRYLYAPVAAELPHRVANTLFARCTGVPLSSCGGQGIIDSTAEDLRTWQAERETREAEAVGEALASGDGGAELRVEIAMDGVMAHIDGRWQEAKVGTILVRRLEAQAEEPTLGAVLARRYVGVLGSAEDLAIRITQVMREAGWERIALGEILGDGAPWIWTVADAHVPGVRQTLDYYHLSEHLYAFAQLQYPNNPAGAKAWVDQKMGALLTDRVGEVLGALKRTQPWKTAVRKALAQLIGYVERNRTRIRYQDPWHRGLAVGSGSVEGACKHVIQSRFKRAGMRWKQPGFLNVLALRIASLNETFEAFWASRGLAVQASARPTK
jgi:Uncharacterised protein family (UPF0236)